MGNRKACRLLVLFTFLLLLPVWGRSASAGETVRIGYYHEANFQEGAGPSDRKQGYAYDYYQRLAQLTDWKYEYVYGDYNMLYKLLQAGKIDFLAGLAYTESRAGQMLFPQRPMGEEHYDLLRRVGDSRLTADPASLNGLKIGVLEGAQTEMLRQYLAKNGVRAQVVVYQEMKNRDSALRQGDVDTIVAEDSIGDFAGLECYDRIGATSFYIVVNKNRPELLAQLDKAQEELLSRQGDIYVSLRQKYFRRTAFNGSLTPAEVAWLGSHKVMRVGYLEDQMPFSGKNGSGEPDGVISELMPLLFSDIRGAEGLAFEYEPYARSVDLQKALQEGKVDVGFPADTDSWIAEQAGIQTTEGFISESWRIVFPEGKYTASPETLAVGKGSLLHQTLARIYYPAAKPVFCTSKEELLAAVKSGRAAATMLDVYDISKLSGTAAYRGLSSQIIDTRSCGFGLNVESTALLSLLNRAISLQKEDFAHDLLLKYNDPRKHLTMLDYFYQHVMEAAGLGLLVIGLCGWVAVTRSRAARRERELNARLQEDAATQEAQLEEITALNTELQTKQANLEEVSCEQEAQLEEIKGLNDSLSEQMGVIRATAQVYNHLYRISLENYSFLEITSRFAAVNRVVRGRGNALEALENFLTYIAEPEFEQELRRFCDLSTINERMKNRAFITCDFKGNVNGWAEGTFIAGDRDEDGNLLNVFWATRDNNEIKEREFAQSKKLEEAVRIADAANAAKTVFLNNMSHDIRTPMNAILGFTSIMKKNLDNPQALAADLDKIESSGKYLLGIINNVLDIARIESGHTILNEAPYDMLDGKVGLTLAFEAAAARKNISYSVTYDLQHRYVMVDSSAGQQITVNIISNAIKYTPENGRVEVRMKEYPGSKPGWGKYVFSCTDTGIGMSEEFQQHLFESFTRERNTTECKVIGTGLGMAIVKKLVDLMHGTVEVESAPGKGTTFRVTMEHEIVAEPGEQPVNRLEQAEARDLGSRRVLLTEDNELNAEIATILLQEQGLLVEHAANGEACIQLLEKQPAGYFDVILMDIQMPVMDGYEATKGIRQLPDKAKAEIPIIAMTANAFEEDKRRVLAAGMDGFCTKPIDIHKLKAELSRLLK